MAKRVGPVGNYLGNAFDDGVFDGVKKIIVSVQGSPYNCITMIKIEYEKDGKLESRQHGTVLGELKEVKTEKFCYKTWILMLGLILFEGFGYLNSTPNLSMKIGKQIWRWKSLKAENV